MNHLLGRRSKCQTRLLPDNYFRYWLFYRKLLKFLLLYYVWLIGNVRILCFFFSLFDYLLHSSQRLLPLPIDNPILRTHNRVINRCWGVIFHQKLGAGVVPGYGCRARRRHRMVSLLLPRRLILINRCVAPVLPDNTRRHRSTRHLTDSW